MSAFKELEQFANNMSLSSCVRPTEGMRMKHWKKNCHCICHYQVVINEQGKHSKFNSALYK